MRRIYLDYAATTPTHPEVVTAMLPYFTEAFGNPSSIHAYGQEAKELLRKRGLKLPTSLVPGVRRLSLPAAGLRQIILP